MGKASYKQIDVNNWKRKQMYDLFSSYREPYHHVVVEVDMRACIKKSKSSDFKLFPYYLHKCMQALHSIDNLRYRIGEEGEIRLYDRIDLSVTVARPDHTFGFSYFEYDENIQKFQSNYEAEAARIQTDLDLFGPQYEISCVHVSTLPWLRFSSLSHARNYDEKTGVPMITFGKIVSEGNKTLMPVAIHVHHGLVDGYHLGLFFERFQELLNQ